MQTEGLRCRVKMYWVDSLNSCRWQRRYKLSRRFSKDLWAGLGMNRGWRIQGCADAGIEL